MTLEELNNTIKDKEARHQTNMRLLTEFRQLQFDFALSNNKVKVGDIVTDHKGSILVTKIYVDLTFGFPCMKYYGRVLEKDETPTEKEMFRSIHQSNLK